MTAEQEARDMLERMGVEDAQSFTAGEVVELANLIAHAHRTEHWTAEGERMLARASFGAWAMFSLGHWWADRPWRRREAA